MTAAYEEKQLLRFAQDDTLRRDDFSFSALRCHPERSEGSAFGFAQEQEVA